MALDLHHSCHMCPFSSSYFTDFVKHTVRMHKNDPRFRVYCEFEGCSFTSKNWNSYKIHVHRFHNQDSVSGDNEAEPVLGLSDGDDDHDHEYDQTVINRPGTNDPDMCQKLLFAHYILKLETSQNLTEITIDTVFDNTQHLMKSYLSQQYQSFYVWLKEKHPDISMDGLNDTLVPLNLSDLCTRLKRDDCFVQHCGLVEPVEVFLGTRMKTVRGQVKTVRDTGFIVPLKSTLQSLLNLPEIIDCLDNPHISNNEYMRDICDGNSIQSHPVFSLDPQALQIILYVDELELVNPLGTHTKKTQSLDDILHPWQYSTRASIAAVSYLFAGHSKTYTCETTWHWQDYERLHKHSKWVICYWYWVPNRRCSTFSQRRPCNGSCRHTSCKFPQWIQRGCGFCS